MSCDLSDPDISGIGVRAAIYIQNLLSFIPAIWALWDGDVSAYELECIETQSTTILITAFAILISAMVEVQTVGMSSFNAIVVLSMSWMNNTNTFIYFLLYVQHKSQPGPEHVDPTWSAWVQHLKGRLSFHLVTSQIKYALKPDAQLEKDAQIATNDPEQQGQEKETMQESNLKNIFRRIVLVLGSLHLSLMAGLGVWLWSNPGSFGGPDQGSCLLESTAILGRKVPLSSEGLRVWSLLIYSIFLLPGFNLLLPIAVFLVLNFTYQARCQNQPTDFSLESPKNKSSSIQGALKSWYNQLPSYPSIVPIIIGMMILLVINLIFLIDIELTLRRAQISDRSSWSFGQVLAMLLIAMPLRDLAETVLKRREKRQDKKRRDEHTASLQLAIKNKTVEFFVDLVDKGADVNTSVKGMGNCST
ncbi:hypothetical protein VKT23_010693 [Stygiomarasmius scandens]|uniref:Uncharacterized protein n=1 Tax=Marasmiellus scandens TaxID=2682957 RepID=A0ABR1JBV4_9AGAR